MLVCYYSVELDERRLFCGFDADGTYHLKDLLYLLHFYWCRLTVGCCDMPVRVVVLVYFSQCPTSLTPVVPRITRKHTCKNPPEIPSLHAGLEGAREGEVSSRLSKEIFSFVGCPFVAAVVVEKRWSCVLHLPPRVGGWVGGVSVLRIGRIYSRIIYFPVAGSSSSTCSKGYVCFCVGSM